MRRILSRILIKTLISFFLVLNLHLVSKAQGVDKTNLTNVVPLTPEIASMGKYIEFPMSYSSGVPVISIPVFTIQSGDLKLPLNLSYNASGHKVEEVAGWTGLGWNLNTGYSLYRVVHGLPDDLTGIGYMHTKKTVNVISNYKEGSFEKKSALLFVRDNTLDAEPDVYYFSAMGYSGKFYFDQTLRQFVQLPKSQVKLDYTIDINGSIVKWIITLPNGIKCFFGQSEDSSRSGYDKYSSSAITIYSTSGGSSLPNGPAAPTPPHITNWQIMDIKSVAGKKIQFFYNDNDCINFGRGGETTDYAGLGACDYVADRVTNYSYYTQSGSKSELSKISFSSGDIYFKTDFAQRKDVIGYGRALDSILVKTKQNNLIKAFKLNTDYWFSAQNLSVGIPPTPGYDANVAAQYRLYLSSVDEINSSLNKKQIYKFKYNNIELPNRLSTAQDYWGYFNNVDNGMTLTPKVRASMINGTQASGYLSGADRRVDTVYNQGRILKSITYPTGGTTSYTYETNRVNKSNINGEIEAFELSGLSQRSLVFVKNSANLVAGTTNTYRTTFTIKPGAILNSTNPVAIAYTGCADFNTFDCPLSTRIVSLTDPASPPTGINSSNFTLSMQPGNYYIETTINKTSFDDPDPEFSVIMQWEEESENTSNKVIAGGLRVRKIESIDNVTGKLLSRSFSYNEFNNSLSSAGRVTHMPVHVYRIACVGYNLGDFTLNPTSPNILRVASQSVAPLVSDDGQAVLYKNVTEYTDDTQLLQKSEYTYSGQPSLSMAQYPFPVNISADWRLGLLTLKRDYEYVSAGLYRPVLSSSSAYKSYESEFKSSIGLKLGSNPTPETVSLGYYDTSTEWQVKVEDRDTTFSYVGNSMSGQKTIKSTIYSYNKNNGYLLTNVRSSTSTGNTTNLRYTYPGDYNAQVGFDVTTLSANNLLDLPVKKEFSVNGKTTGGEIINYNAAGKPIEIYDYSSAVLTDTTAINRDYVLTPGYRLKTLLKYNNVDLSLLAEIKPYGGTPVSYIWSYNNQYPVAQIKNADYSSVESLLGGAAAVNTFSNSEPTDAQVNDFVNPLRGSLSKAHITSFTHKPLIGTTSNTDAKGMVTYFEYDDFQRLWSIKDQHGYIMKSFDYNYKQ